VQEEVRNGTADEVMRPKVDASNSMATSSSLNSIHISPRTPKTPKTSRMGLDDAEEGVELSLLGEEERREALRGVEHIPTKRPIGAKDKRGMVLLCVLCKCTRIARGASLSLMRDVKIDLIQGVPVRLSSHKDRYSVELNFSI
jgi:hypothetical protein